MQISHRPQTEDFVDIKKSLLKNVNSPIYDR